MLGQSFKTFQITVNYPYTLFLSSSSWSFPSSPRDPDTHNLQYIGASELYEQKRMLILIMTLMLRQGVHFNFCTNFKSRVFYTFSM